MARYFLERTYKWDGEQADYTPESNDIPWTFVPEKLVSVEDVRYLMGSHYQGTPYDPYDQRSALKGKYRTIGLPNSDVCGIQQIRGDLPDPIKGIQWFCMGGSAFTACFPFYTQVDALPAYISKTSKAVSTDYMYWQSRLIGALVDAQYHSAIVFAERYQNAVFNQSRQLLNEYDERILNGEDPKILKEANGKITDMVKKESDKVLETVLRNDNQHAKIFFHRGDNCFASATGSKTKPPRCAHGKRL